MLQRWLSALERERALIGSRAEAEARLTAWVPWIVAAVGGDPAAEAELLRIVALDARNLAQESRAASTVVTQSMLLDEAWPEPPHAVRRLTRLLVRVAADAHALGAMGVREAAHRRLLADHTPVVPIEGRWLGFLMGPPDPDVIDGVLGRLLRAAAGAGAKEVGLDLSASPGPDPVLLRTLDGFAGMDTGPVRRLTVLGLETPQTLRVELARRDIPPQRVAVTTLTEWLSGPAT